MRSKCAHVPLTAFFHLLARSMCSCDLCQGSAEVHPTPAAPCSHPALRALLVPPDTEPFNSTLAFLGQAL